MVLCSSLLATLQNHLSHCSKLQATREKIIKSKIAATGVYFTLYYSIDEDDKNICCRQHFLSATAVDNIAVLHILHNLHHSCNTCISKCGIY